MAVLDALGSPVRVRPARHVLDFVERILHVGPERRAGVYMLLPHAVARIHGEYRLDVQVLAPLQVFKQAQAVGALVAPGAGVRRTVDERADGLLPLVALREVVAFQIVAAGQAEERRVHRGQLLHQVDAVAVRAVVVGRREQGSEREVESTGLCNRKHEVVVRAWLHVSRGKHRAVLLPRRTHAGYRGLRDGPAGVIVQQRHHYGSIRRARLGVKRSPVAGARTQRDAPVPFVFEPRLAFGRGRRDLHL